MKRTQIQLTEDQAERVKECAEKRAISMAECIRRSVDYYLDSTECLTSQERVDRAINAAGQFASGESDISDEHDQYLGDIYGQ